VNGTETYFQIYLQTCFLVPSQGLLVIPAAHVFAPLQLSCRSALSVKDTVAPQIMNFNESPVCLLLDPNLKRSHKDLPVSLFESGRAFMAMPIPLLYLLMD
jgi:hypothetical protein